MNLGDMTPKFIWKNKLSKNSQKKKSENVVTVKIWGDLDCQIVKRIGTL